MTVTAKFPTVVCFSCFPGAFVSVTCEWNGHSFPGGGDVADQGAVPEAGHAHQGHERGQRQDGLQVPTRLLRARVPAAVCTEWSVIESGGITVVLDDDLWDVL